MSTKKLFVNDDFAFFAVNMKTTEAIIRLVFAATLIGVLMAEPTMAYKMLLVVVAVYLFTTAITRWEPLYAWMGRNPMKTDVSHLRRHKNEGDLRHDIHHDHGVRPANDGKGNDKGIKSSA